MLGTSVLERVSGPRRRSQRRLGSERILQQLEDANAFVTSLDAGRSWFRYHHLFADLLRLELRRSDPAGVGPLHRKAAQWYEKHGYPVDAIRHAQAATDWPSAARLLAELARSALDGRQATVHALLAAFPAEAPAENAELACSRRTACSTARSRRPAHTSPPPRKRQGPYPRSALAPRPGAGRHRLSLARRQGDLEAATEAMQSLEAASKAGPRATSGSATTTGRRR